MKPLYIASLYYNNRLASGANKRFDAIGKCLVARLGEACYAIVPDGQKPVWIGEERCITVPAFSSNLGKLWSFLHFELVLRRLPSGVVINDFIPIPFLALRRHEHFQLIHDFRDFTAYKRDQVPLLATHILRWQLQRSQRVITVSEVSKRDAVELCGLREQDIICSYNGIDDIYAGTREISRDIDLLYVATFEARKNHERLLQALALIQRPLKVCFVGRDHGLQTAMKLRAESLREKCGMTFEFIDRTGEEQLVQLYQRTRTYACPSVLEGFGMPLVEALAANCRVACSDIPVFHEVCQEHALYFDPQDPVAIAACLEKSLALPVPKEARQYAQRFSWESITDDLLVDIGYPVTVQAMASEAV